MRHAKSNINILKQQCCLTPHGNFNYGNTGIMRNMYKSPTDRNTILVLGNNNKKLFTKNLSVSNKKKNNKGNIFTNNSKGKNLQSNLRLTIGSETLNTYHLKSNNFLEEIINEKDKQIAELQKELLKSHSIISQLQKEKETIATSMTIHNIMNSNNDNIEEITTSSNLSPIKTTLSSLRTNYYYTNNNEIQNIYLLSKESSKGLGSPSTNPNKTKTPTVSSKFINVFRKGKNKIVKLRTFNSPNGNNLSGINENDTITVRHSISGIPSLESLVSQCDTLKQRTKRIFEKYFYTVSQYNI